MSEYVLEARNIVKTFPGVRALDHVDIGVRKGEVHAIVGENGAGKSTLMMILGGIYKANEGQVFVNGRLTDFNSPEEAIKGGIGIVFQELSLVQQMSVAENIFFNHQPVNKAGFVNFKKMNEDTTKMLALFGMQDIDPRTQIRFLSMASQQVIEILKAMSENPAVLVLDEPTSSLTDVEAAKLFANIKKLKQTGMAFIFISHHLSEIFDIADTVTVFRDGKKVVTKPVSEVNERFLISNMVGRDIQDIYGHRDPADKIGDVIFEAKNLCEEHVFSDVSFHVRKGEIVGFSGLVGAGRTEVGRAIFGADKMTSGEMILAGKKVAPASPQEAIKCGIAYMTEDRKLLGLYLNFDILQNMAANRLSDFTEKGFINGKKLNAACGESVKDFNIVTPSLKQTIGNLSGGNQQKVLLAEWVGTHPKLLIVDEPTRGVDVGAKFEIYQILRKMAAVLQCGIVMISSDLPEVLGVSDRIYIMKDGRISGEVSGAEATEEKVMLLAAGSDKDDRRQSK